jgi:flagellar biosynthetic protein FliS
MNALHAYRQQQALSWTRIDMLLALYRGAIDRLERALAAIERADASTAKPLLLRAQRMVTELLAGIDLQYGDLPDRLAKLYTFVLRAIGQGTVEQIRSAISVLKTLQEGLEGIRDQAVNMERSGEIPPIDAGAALMGSV